MATEKLRDTSINWTTFFFNYQIHHIKLRHINTFLHFRVLFHEPHCTASTSNIITTGVFRALNTIFDRCEINLNIIKEYQHSEFWFFILHGIALIRISANYAIKYSWKEPRMLLSCWWYMTWGCIHILSLIKLVQKTHGWEQSLLLDLFLGLSVIPRVWYF